MKSFIRIPIIIVMLFLWSGGAIAQGNLKFANMGNYRLESGQVIRSCRIAYRTFGVLHSDKSNAVLFPTLDYNDKRPLFLATL